MNTAAVPKQDMHVHSTFSDGNNTIEENIEEAESLGLASLTCVDHVRADTEYLPDYVAAIQRLRPTTEIELICGIEAKLLDTSGTLDLPPVPEGVDRIYAADHQVPLEDGPHHPREVKLEIESGDRDAAGVISAIIESTTNAARRHRNMVIAHMFSLLPKLGLSESDVPAGSLDELARVTAETRNMIEISERWRCPTAATLRPFVDHGVTVLMSTDSHKREHIGRYEFGAEVWRQLQ
ncbi:MAG: PHP domain-containing protein [Solirubrobacterales bacterium]